jgi:glutamyl-tRNA synthetase
VAKHWKDREGSAKVLRVVRDRLADTEWDTALMEEALRKLAEELGLSSGKVFQPLRVALVGQLASPGIFDVLTVLGRDRSLSRLDAAWRSCLEPRVARNRVCDPQSRFTIQIHLSSPSHESRQCPS